MGIFSTIFMTLEGKSKLFNDNTYTSRICKHTKKKSYYTFLLVVDGYLRTQQ